MTKKIRNKEKKFEISKKEETKLFFGKMRHKYNKHLNMHFACNFFFKLIL
jgi:hypothetical protein